MKIIIHNYYKYLRIYECGTSIAFICSKERVLMNFRNTIKRISFIFILSVFLIAAETPNPYVTSTQDIESILKCAQQRIKTSPSSLSLIIKPNDQITYYFKDADLSLATSKTLKLKTDLESLANFTDKNPLESDEQFKTLKSIIGRYLNISATLHALYAKAFHVTKLVEQNSNLNFDQLKFLDLILPSFTAIGALSNSNGGLDYANNIRNDVDQSLNSTTRLTLSHQEKQLAELSALMEPKNEKEYAKLIQFATIRDSAVNRWAINRLSVYETKHPTNDFIQSCGNNLLSFRSTKPIQATTKLPSIIELNNSDKYILILENQKSIFNAIEKHNLIDLTTAQNIIHELFLPYKSKMNEANFKQWTIDKAKEAIEFENFVFSKMGESFVFASHATYDNMDLNQTILRQSSKMFYFRLNNLRNKLNEIASIYSSISLKQINDSFLNVTTKLINQSKWIEDEKSLIKPVFENIFSQQNMIAKSFKNREHKIKSLLDITNSTIPYAYELNMINQFDYSDAKLKMIDPRNLQYSKFVLGINNVEDLKLLLENKLTLSGNDYLMQTYQSSEYVKNKINDLFKNIEEDAKANPNIAFAAIASRNAVRLQKDLKKLYLDPNYPKLKVNIPNSAPQDNLKNKIRYVTYSLEGEDACAYKNSKYDSSKSLIEQSKSWSQSSLPLTANYGLTQLSNSSKDIQIDTMNPSQALYSLLSMMNLTVLDIWLNEPEVQKNGVLRDNTQLLPTVYEHKMISQAKVSLLYSANPLLSTTWNEKSLLEHLATEAYSPYSNQVDVNKAKSVLNQAISYAYSNDAGKLEMFCQANYDQFISQVNAGIEVKDKGLFFRKMFRIASATRAAINGDNKTLLEFDTALAKKARTTTEKYMEDIINPILSYSFIAMLVLGFIFMPMLTGTVAAPVLVNLLAVLNWGVMAPTAAANLGARLFVNFIEKPVEFRFEESVAKSFIQGSPDPQLEGGPITDWEQLKLKKAELKISQYSEPIYLAMDLWYGKSLYNEAKSVLGFGIKSAAKKLKVNLRSQYENLKTFKPTRSFTEIKEESGTLKAIQTKSAEALDDLARKMKLPKYQNINAEEVEIALRKQLSEQLPKDIQIITPEIDRAKRFAERRLNKFKKAILKGSKSSNILGNSKLKTLEDELPINPEVIMQLGSQSNFMTMYGIFPKSFIQMLWKSSKDKVVKIIEALKGSKPTEEQLSEIYQIISNDTKIKAWWKQWGEFTTLVHDMRLMFLKDKVAAYDNLLYKIKFAQENHLSNSELINTFTSDELQLLHEAGTLNRYIHLLGFLPDIVKPNVWVEDPPLFRLRSLFTSANELRMHARPIHPFMSKISESELEQYEPTHYYDAATDSYVPMDQTADASAWSRSSYDFDGSNSNSEMQKQIFKLLPESFNKASK